VEKNVEGHSPGPRGPQRPELRLGALAPTPSRCPSLRFGTAAVCGLASGPCGLFPRPFSAALRGPASLLRARPGPLRGAWPPLARLRQPPGAPAGALARAALRPGAACGCFGLRSGARPAGLCGLRVSRPWPSPGGPCVRLRRPRIPLPAPCGSALWAARARPARGLCRPGGRPLRPAPGRGVGVARCGARGFLEKRHNVPTKRG